MTKGSPARLILLFTYPLLLGNIFQQFYSMADTFIVSRTLGMDALAAVGSTGSIMFLIIGLAIGLTAGLSVITAQRFGKKDERSLRKSLGVSVVISFVIGILLTIFAVTFAKQILVVMQTPPEIIDQAYQYIVVIFAGVGATLFFNLLSNILRAIGDSKTPLYFLIVTSILNIILDYVFILGFNMGVAGAGFATVISQFIASLLCLIYIGKKVPMLRIYKDDWTLEWSEYKEHLRIGLPYGFQYSIIAVGAVAVQVTLNQLGSTAVAAYTAASKINQLLTMPLQSFGITMSTYAAQNFGARKMDRIWDGVRAALKMVIIYSILIGLLLFVAGRPLAGVFIDANDVQALDMAQQYFLIHAPMYIFLSFVFIFRHTLQGLGNSFAPTIAGIMELASRVFGAVILSQFFGFAGAALANPLAWIGATIPLLIAYFQTKRRIQLGEPAVKKKQPVFSQKKRVSQPLTDKKL